MDDAPYLGAYSRDHGQDGHFSVVPPSEDEMSGFDHDVTLARCGGHELRMNRVMHAAFDRCGGVVRFVCDAWTDARAIDEWRRWIARHGLL